MEFFCFIYHETMKIVFYHCLIKMFFMSSLGFLTGCRKVPVLGMNQVTMKIRIKQIQTGSHDQHFPESLTCHSIFELPLYSTKEIMRERLTEALTPERGFRTWSETIKMEGFPNENILNTNSGEYITMH